uniref:Cyclin-dependent kinase inhibitor 1B n=1 Tax=Anser cygnoides TaxID=8845 RepID=A0A8B9EQ78_ANSCY
MSNVRISNGSPTLERMEARQSEYPKPSACRNLFGPVNHEELNRDLKKHRKEMEEACQRKWNFDFQNHKPLEGRYEWQAVEKGSSPEFYFRPPRLLKAVCKSAGHQSLDVNGNCQTVIFVGSQGISEHTHCVDQKTALSEKQTDFAEQCTGQRKRPATDGNVPFGALFLACPAGVSATRGPTAGGLRPAGCRPGPPRLPTPPKAQALFAAPGCVFCFGGVGGVPR